MKLFTLKGMTVMNVAKGFEKIDELPISASPWRIHALPSAVVLVNPEHQPRIIRNGVIEVLSGQKPASHSDACLYQKAMAISGASNSQSTIRG